MAGERFYADSRGAGGLRSAPAALRNREPIAEVLAEWLPPAGLVLEVASGTGEHSAFFAGRFPGLEWRPSDVHPDALESIRARVHAAKLHNLREPMVIDAAAGDWPIGRADAILNINMVHISPWQSALGLIEGAHRLLGRGAPLILYGPWLKRSIATAPSNLAFDADLKQRDPRWGLRSVDDFEGAASARGLQLADERPMPANNRMLLFRRQPSGKKLSQVLPADAI